MIKVLKHHLVDWISGTATVVSDRTTKLSATCSKCSDQTLRFYCCLKIAEEYGWRNYAYLHSACDRK